MTTQTQLAALDAAARLLPCPFCGGKPLIGQTLDDAWYAMCENDHCARLDSYWRTKLEAIAAWNTRANKLVLVPSVEEVSEIVWRVLYGNGSDPFLNSAGQDFCEKVATAVLASMGAKTDG